MFDKTKHVAAAAEALELFRRRCGTSDEHAIADLICDLGHLAEERDLDFLNELKRGLRNWFAEHHSHEGDRFGLETMVDISITPR